MSPNKFPVGYKPVGNAAVGFSFSFASGPIQYVFSAVASVVASSSILKQTGKILSFTVALVLTYLKACAKTLSSFCSLSITYLKSVRIIRTANFTVAFTSIIKSVGKIFTEFITSTVILVQKAVARTLMFSIVVTFVARVRAVTKSAFNTSVTLSATILKSIGKILTETITVGFVLVRKAIAHTITAFIILSSTIMKAITTTKIFAITCAGNIQKTGRKFASGAISLTALLFNRAITKTITFVVIITSGVQKTVIKLAFVSSITLTAFFTFIKVKLLTVNFSLSMTFSFIRRMIGKFLTNGITLTALLFNRALLRTLSFGMTCVDQVQKQINKNKNTIVTLTFLFSRMSFKSVNLTFNVLSAVFIQKVVSITKTYIITLTAQNFKSMLKSALLASITVRAFCQKQAGSVRSYIVNNGVQLTKSISKIVLFGFNALALITKAIAKLAFNAKINLTTFYSSMKVNLITRTASFTVSFNFIQKIVSKILSSGATLIALISTGGTANFFTAVATISNNATVRKAISKTLTFGAVCKFLIIKSGQITKIAGVTTFVNIRKNISKSLLFITNTLSTITKMIGKFRTTGVILSSMMLRTLAYITSFGAIISASILKLAGKKLNETISASFSAFKSILKSLSFTSTMTALIKKTLQKTYTFGVVCGLTTQRVYGVVRNAIGSLIVTTRKVIARTLNFKTFVVFAPIKSVSRTLSTSFIIMGTIRKQARRSLIFAITPIFTVQRIISRSITFGMNFIASRIRLVGKQRATIVHATVSRTKSVQKRFIEAVSMSFTAFTHRFAPYIGTFVVSLLATASTIITRSVPHFLTFEMNVQINTYFSKWLNMIKRIFKRFTERETPSGDFKKTRKTRYHMIDNE